MIFNFLIPVNQYVTCVATFNSRSFKLQISVSWCLGKCNSTDAVAITIEETGYDGNTGPPTPTLDVVVAARRTVRTYCAIVAVRY